MFTQPATQGTDLNKYRFVWINPDLQGIQYGTFLFNSPEDASPAKNAMEQNFPDYVIWLEDREHNKIEM